MSIFISVKTKKQSDRIRVVQLPATVLQKCEGAIAERSLKFGIFTHTTL
jgi:hypothetical protein